MAETRDKLRYLDYQTYRPQSFSEATDFADTDFDSDSADGFLEEESPYTSVGSVCPPQYTATYF